MNICLRQNVLPLIHSTYFNEMDTMRQPHPPRSSPLTHRTRLIGPRSRNADNIIIAPRGTDGFAI